MTVVIKRPDEAEIEKQGIRSWPIWEKGISTFPWFYDEAETCYFLEGEVTVTDTKTGASYEIKKGDLVTFPAGLSCTWEIRKPVKKHYRFGEP